MKTPQVPRIKLFSIVHVLGKVPIFVVTCISLVALAAILCDFSGTLNFDCDTQGCHLNLEGKPERSKVP